MKNYRLASRAARGSAFRSAVTMALVLVGMVLGVTPAFAHGEDKQPPNLRTRTVHFYDVQFSNPELKVGEPFTVQGNFYVTQDWPDGVVNPDVTQLTVVAPGPTVLVKDRTIDGKFVAESMRLEKGRNYPFSITMEARRPGDWHIHPMIAVKGAGGLIGPGQWIHVADVPGAPAFTNNITLRDGETVDLESYNTDTAVIWHLLYIIPAVLFLLYWFSKPLVPRLVAIVSGEKTPDELVTKRDVKVSVMLTLVVLGVTAVGFVYAFIRWPDTIPLQVQNTAVPAGQVLTGAVSAETTAPASFRPEQNSIATPIKLRNNGQAPLTLTEFETGNVRFGLTPDPATPAVQMTLNGPPTLAPGEQRELLMTLVAPDFAQHALIPKSEVSQDIGGLLVFKDPGGATSLAELAVPVITERAQAMGR